MYSNQPRDLIKQYRVRILILQLCDVPQYVFLCDDAQQTTVHKANKTTTHCKHHNNNQLQSKQECILHSKVIFLTG